MHTENKVLLKVSAFYCCGEGQNEVDVKACEFNCVSILPDGSKGRLWSFGMWTGMQPESLPCSQALRFLKLSKRCLFPTIAHQPLALCTCPAHHLFISSPNYLNLLFLLPYYFYYPPFIYFNFRLHQPCALYMTYVIVNKLTLIFYNNILR